MNFRDILEIVTIVLVLVLLTYEYRRDLMMFQQNSYRHERYLRWLRSSGDTTSYTRLIGIFLLLFSLAGFGLHRFAIMCVALFAVCAGATLARRKYKKPLVMTLRATRLFVSMFVISAVILTTVLLLSKHGVLGSVSPLYSAIVCMLSLYCFSHIILMAAAFVLKPVEARIRRKFYDDAASRLNSMKELKVIGITGSYGKTSTKHYLYRILSEHFETLMTPGSFNTTLGVVRTIREHLKPYHQVFIVEMGAKQKGDIKEICNLVHPSIGIITAVGPQHLETFKTLENVRDTKFELVDSLDVDGVAVLNNDYPIIAERQVDKCKSIRYSCYEKADNRADYVATDIKYGKNGTCFTLICPDGKRIELETKLLGEYNIANLVGAIAVARQLNVPEDKIRYSVSRIEPVEHRLSMRRHSNGLTILDDAFNSNPVGAAMAVDVLSRMDEGRRIIITPGMIELGEKQEELNREFGRQIAESGIEYVAVVGHYNRDAIMAGLVEGGMDSDAILTFDTFLAANAWLTAFAKSGDVALIENDLPDTFK